MIYHISRSSYHNDRTLCVPVGDMSIFDTHISDRERISLQKKAEFRAKIELDKFDINGKFVNMSKL